MTETNFCAQCGKRLGLSAGLGIHTCTKPQERSALTDAELNALFDRSGGTPAQPTYNETKRGKP